MISKSILGLSFGFPWIIVALIWRDGVVECAREQSHAWYSESLGKYGDRMYRFKTDSLKEEGVKRRIEERMKAKGKR